MTDSDLNILRGIRHENIRYAKKFPRIRDMAALWARSNHRTIMFFRWPFNYTPAEWLEFTNALPKWVWYKEEAEAYMTMVTDALEDDYKDLKATQASLV